MKPSSLECSNRIVGRLATVVLVGLLAVSGVVHAQPIPPSVATLPASTVGATNATLNGTANPNSSPTFGLFEWGTTTNYGNVTPAQALGGGSVNTNFSQLIAGLSGGVSYHFRAVASNSFNSAYGTNQSFTTPPFTFIANLLPGVYYGSVAGAIMTTTGGWIF